MERPFMDGVPADPMPWLTERFREYGVYDSDITPVVRMSRILGVAQSTVNALSDGKASYRVKFASDAETAFTDAKTHTVTIGTGPALDRSLTDGQRAAILIAMTAHEVGHVRWSVTMLDRLQTHYADDPFKAAWAARVFNIAHDIHLEHWMRDDFRVLDAILDIKGRYFCKPWDFDASRNVTRYGALINATLYPHATDWTVSDEAKRFKDFADQWAEKCKAKGVRRLQGAVEVIEEALAFIDYRTSEDVPPEENPSGTGRKPDEVEEDDDEPEDGEPGEPEEGDEPGEGDEGEDGEETGEGEGDESSASGGQMPPESEEDFREGEDGSGEGPRHQDGETLSDDDDDGDADGGADGDDEGEDGEESDGRVDASRNRPSNPEADPDGDTFDEGEDDEDMVRENLDTDVASDTFDSKPQDLPTLHGEMHTADDAEWQDAVNEYERTLTSERDRFVVGGGATFAKREMRIVRIRK